MKSLKSNKYSNDPDHMTLSFESELSAASQKGFNQILKMRDIFPEYKILDNGKFKNLTVPRSEFLNALNERLGD